MRVTVDAARCQGHALCAAAAPGVFELSDEDGHSSVPAPEVPPDRKVDVQAAAANCPERAISVGEG